MNLAYDIIAAQMCGIAQHPQELMRYLGISYERAVPQSIGDQWWFYGCKNVPNPLPCYLWRLKE